MVVVLSSALLKGLNFAYKVQRKSSVRTSVLILCDVMIDSYKTSLLCACVGCPSYSQTVGLLQEAMACCMQL